MQELLSGFLGNESAFGRLMTRIGIILGANLMFVLFSLPVVTAGASAVALYHVMFKTLRSDGVINPFRAFWKGFRSNFVPATLVWIAACLLSALAVADLRILSQAEGILAMFRFPVLAICAILCVLLLYFFPTTSAFDASVPGLLRNSLYFIMRKPWKAVVILFFDIFPLYLTYTDPQMMPLYAFIWFFFGFGAVAMIGAALLMPEFRPWLDEVDAGGDFILDEHGERVRPGAAVSERSEREILEEMKKLGM